MFPGEAHFLIVHRQSRAHTWNFVGGNGHSNAGCTHENSAVRTTGRDAASDCRRVIRIVGGFDIMSTEILYSIPLALKPFAQFLLEGKSCMVGGKGNFHWGIMQF